VPFWINFPKSGSIILIAHSLGSVVAVDLLTKLHPNLSIDLLVTIGSPLAIKHLSNPAVAAVIGHHAFGVQDSRRSSSIQRRLHPAWQPLLLSFAYSTQLSSCTEGKRWLFKNRIDTARSLLAKRTVADVHVSRQQVVEKTELRLDDSPVGEGRFPNEDDLLHHAADLVRGAWTDEALLSLAVGLEMSPPLCPFDIKVSDQHRHRILFTTLNLVREGHGRVTDTDFAEAVREGVKAGQNAVKESGFPWGTVLIGGGLLLPFLTGAGGGGRGPGRLGWRRRHHGHTRGLWAGRNDRRADHGRYPRRLQLASVWV